MKLLKETFWYIVCYVIYLLLIMFFTYPIIIGAYKLGFSIEQINNNMWLIMSIALAVTLTVVALVARFVEKYKG